MSEITWIKVAVETFNDEKMKLIQSMPDGDAIVVIWFRLLMQAGKSNSGGLIQMSNGKPYSLQMLSVLFDRNPTIMDFAFRTFIEFGMIEETNQGFYIVNWEKHQNVAGMEKIREQTRKRVAKHREQQKALQIVEGNGECNVTVTQSNETDKELDKELDKDIYTAAAEETSKSHSIDSELSKVMQYADKYYPGMINGMHMQEFTRFLDAGLSADLLIRGITEMRMDNKPWKWLFAKYEGQKNDGIRTCSDAERWEEERKRQNSSSKQWKQNKASSPEKTSSKYDVFYQLYQQKES